MLKDFVSIEEINRYLTDPVVNGIEAEILKIKNNSIPEEILIIDGEIKSILNKEAQNKIKVFAAQVAEYLEENYEKVDRFSDEIWSNPPKERHTTTLKKSKTEPNKANTSSISFKKGKTSGKQKAIKNGWKKENNSKS